MVEKRRVKVLETVGINGKVEDGAVDPYTVVNHSRTGGQQLRKLQYESLFRGRD